jgi:hypothetical protein
LRNTTQVPAKYEEQAVGCGVSWVFTRDGWLQSASIVVT